MKYKESILDGNSEKSTVHTNIINLNQKSNAKHNVPQRSEKYNLFETT
jgi:hypothetical protein